MYEGKDVMSFCAYVFTFHLQHKVVVDTDLFPVLPPVVLDEI